MCNVKQIDHGLAVAARPAFLVLLSGCKRCVKSIWCFGSAQILVHWHVQDSANNHLIRKHDAFLLTKRSSFRFHGCRMGRRDAGRVMVVRSQVSSVDAGMGVGIKERLNRVRHFWSYKLNMCAA